MRLSWITGALALGGIVSGALSAQEYQSRFAGLTYDRAKGPATLHAGLEVDAASGAVDVNLPLGPGIGTRGVAFRPVLSGHLAPTVDGVLRNAGKTYFVPAFDTQRHMDYQFSLSPGHLDLALSDDSIGDVDEGIVVSNYQLPDASTGSFNAKTWAPADPDLPGDPSAVLAAFGYAGYVPAPLPARGTAVTGPFLRRDSNGYLVIGLQKSGDPTFCSGLKNCTNPGVKNGLSGEEWSVPAKVLVIRGEIAWEFSWLGGTYGNSIDYEAEPVALKAHILRSGHYRLSAILNRFGEAVRFLHDASDGGYTATWMNGVVAGGGGTPAGPAIQVQVAWGASDQGAVAGTVAINYINVDHGPSYTLECSFSGPGGFSIPPLNGMNYADIGDLSRPVQPNLIKCNSSAESIRFTYNQAPGYGALGWNGQPGKNLLSSVTFNDCRTVTFTWQAYLYGRNLTFPGRWTGYRFNSGIDARGSSALSRPSWFYGVSDVLEMDYASGLRYPTHHERVVPVINYSSQTPAPGAPWASTAFYDAITHPDGSVTLNRFLEPVQGPDLDSDAHQVQSLGHLKHLLSEVRHYTPDRAETWREDLGRNAGQSTAYRIENHDRFDLRSEANPSGLFSYSAVPSSTRTRSWDADTRVLTCQERTGWNPQSSQLGWAKEHTQVSVDSDPALVRPEGRTDLLSLARTGSGPSYPASGASYWVLARTFDSDPAQWLLGRVGTEQVTRQTDGTGYLSGSTPLTLPMTTLSYASPAGTLKQHRVRAEDGTEVSTSYTPWADSGLGAGQVKTVAVTGTGCSVPAPGVGVSYGYDGAGWLNQIQATGIGWNLQQTSDGLGRPITQTDGNGLLTWYEWDDAGRLSAIRPPEVQATTIGYDDTDHRGATVSHGSAQQTEYRYSGLGQLVLIRRATSKGQMHKAFDYDKAGRKLFESVWLAGAGSDFEGHGSSAPGSRWSYDGRGREVSHSDGNGQVTTTRYDSSNGLVRTIVTSTPGQPETATSQFTMDALGHLARVDTWVTVDGMSRNYVTVYKHDAAGRTAEVNQFDAAVPGQVQVRQWGYHPMGWLNRLIQPESGETRYDSFTVTGLPSLTSYLGDGGGPAKTVSTSYDTLMRVVAVASNDGTVSQAFVYDGADVAGRSSDWFGRAKGKLSYARDSAVETLYSFKEKNGALSSLDTQVWLDQSVNQGPSRLFSQAFELDEYGNRTLATAGQTTVRTSYDLALGLPLQVTANGVLVADGTLDEVGNLTTLAYGDTVQTSFQYDLDQARLTGLAHTAGATPLNSWTYRYNGLGQLTDTGEDSFQYDELNRLLGAQVKRLNGQGQPDPNQVVSQSFRYDAFGNLTSRVSAGLSGNGSNNFTFSGTELASLATRNRLPTLASGVPTGASYDAQGNLLSLMKTANSQNQGGLGLSYDALGRVTQLQDLDPGVRQTFSYTCEGLRTMIQEWVNGQRVRIRFNIYNDVRQLVSQWVME